MARGGIEQIGVEVVEGELAPVLAPDQPGVAQHPDVVGDVGLLEIEVGDQMAHAGRAAGEHLDDLCPDRVGQQTGHLERITLG
jgi:hypothetical protein